jgi:hypothetical protein
MVLAELVADRRRLASAGQAQQEVDGTYREAGVEVVRDDPMDSGLFGQNGFSLTT